MVLSRRIAIGSVGARGGGPGLGAEIQAAESSISARAPAVFGGLPEPDLTDVCRRGGAGVAVGREQKLEVGRSSVESLERPLRCYEGDPADGGLSRLDRRHSGQRRAWLSVRVGKVREGVGVPGCCGLCRSRSTLAPPAPGLPPHQPRTAHRGHHRGHCPRTGRRCSRRARDRPHPLRHPPRPTGTAGTSRTRRSMCRSAIRNRSRSSAARSR